MFFWKLRHIITLLLEYCWKVIKANGSSAHIESWFLLWVISLTCTCYFPFAFFIKFGIICWGPASKVWLIFGSFWPFCQDSYKGPSWPALGSEEILDMIRKTMIGIWNQQEYLQMQQNTRLYYLYVRTQKNTQIFRIPQLIKTQKSGKKDFDVHGKIKNQLIVCPIKWFQ